MKQVSKVSAALQSKGFQVSSPIAANQENALCTDSQDNRVIRSPHPFPRTNRAKACHMKPHSMPIIQSILTSPSLVVSSELLGSFEEAKKNIKSMADIANGTNGSSKNLLAHNGLLHNYYLAHPHKRLQDKNSPLDDHRKNDRHRLELSHEDSDGDDGVSLKCHSPFKEMKAQGRMGVQYDGYAGGQTDIKMRKEGIVESPSSQLGIKKGMNNNHSMNKLQHIHVNPNPTPSSSGEFRPVPTQLASNHSTTSLKKNIYDNLKSSLETMAVSSKEYLNVNRTNNNSLNNLISTNSCSSLNGKLPNGSQKTLHHSSKYHQEYTHTEQSVRQQEDYSINLQAIQKGGRINYGNDSHSLTHLGKANHGCHNVEDNSGEYNKLNMNRGHDVPKSTYMSNDGKIRRPLMRQIEKSLINGNSSLTLQSNAIKSTPMMA